jgi:7-cyano-7-deazaguanine synthase
MEIRCAQRVAQQVGAEQHLVADIDLRIFGGSALTADQPVPKDRSVTELSSDIPVTYVPARNTIFLAYSLAWAEVLQACDIFIGVNAVDYSGYPDCRPEYIAAFVAMANLATKAGVEGKQPLRIHTPLMELTKAQIIARGLSLGVDYGLTSSCYDPSQAGEACGACDSCQLRLRGFEQNGIRDPIPYQKKF